MSDKRVRRVFAPLHCPLCGADLSLFRDPVSGEYGSERLGVACTSCDFAHDVVRVQPYLDRERRYFALHFTSLV